MSDRTAGREQRERRVSRRPHSRTKPAEPSPPIDAELQRRVEERTVDLESMVRQLEKEIARRRDVEEQLRAREERLQLALDAGRMGTWDLDLATGTILFDRRAHVILGRYGPPRITLEDLMSALHPDDRPAAERALSTALDPRGTGRWELEQRIVLPDRAVRWIASSGRTLFRGTADSRQPVRILGTIADVTDRKRGERRQRFLAEASARLAESLDLDETLNRLAALATTVLADFSLTYLLERDGRRIRRAGLVHAQAEKQALLEDLQRFELGTDRDTTTAGRVIATGEPLFVHHFDEPFLESVAVDADHLAVGQALEATSVVIVPLRAHGKTLGAFLVATVRGGKPPLRRADVRMLQELGARAALAVENAQLYEQARRAVREREDVVAIVSHDLRNPLHTISMSVGVLGNHDLAPERRSTQSLLVRRAVKQMTRLIEDLLDSSTIGAGRLRIEPRPLEPGKLVSEAVEMAAGRLEGKRVDIRAEVPDRLPSVLADSGRILQIFSNLLGNAIGVTPAEGSVTVRARAADGGVEFAVCDTGPGIPLEDQQYVFDRFWKASSNPSRGAGLGLTIAKGIAEAHGGRIWLKSEPGRGSTFFFWIPGAPRTGTVASPAAAHVSLSHRQAGDDIRS